MFQVFSFLFITLLHTAVYAHNVNGVQVVLETNEAPPFWSQTLPHNGMAGELLGIIAKESGVSTQISFVPLSRMVESDTNNDLGNPAFFIVNQEFSHIIPFLFYHTNLYCYNGAQQCRESIKDGVVSLENLQGKKVGLLKGSNVDRKFFIDNGVKIEESYNQASLFKKLKQGRLDMVIAVELVGQHYIGALFPNEFQEFYSMRIKDSVQPIAILLSEETEHVDEISSRYRQALKKIIENGIYEKVVMKYYKSHNLPSQWYDDLKKFELIYKE